ncbi:MAG: pyruvate, phosphate dikinase [Anaerolineae bacterium]|nr:pyruvate, phosphate dikinase [Anaerolineae bacterium]
MQTKSDLILPLADASAELAQVGGKGASLARLATTGLPVPPGFHVTTAAYRRFVEENALQPHILAALEAAVVTQPDTLEAASAQIRDRFTQAAIPPAIAGEIRAAYLALSNPEPSVAVRSSATAEDLPDASFAGQQETYLNIQGEDAVLEAVRNCWASLWTGRAIAYRLRQGIPSDGVALAVVVQTLVPAEAAGILFTANPMNGRRDEIVINAAWGLGEAIVGGQVTPDTIIADKVTGRIKQIQVADKAVMTARTVHGTAEQPVEESRRNKRVLDDTAIAGLVDLGRRIEALYGAPQDIEWCRDGDRIFIVQSRPITTLFPLPTPLPAPEDGLHVYVCVNVVLQGITEPFTPMGMEIFRISYAGMMDDITGKRTDAHQAWVKKAAGRMYVDITNLVRDPKTGMKIAERMLSKDGVAVGLLAQIVAANAGEFQGNPKLKLPLPVFFNILPKLLGPVLYGYLAPRAARKKLQAMGDAWVVPLEKRARSLTGIAERLSFVDEACRKVFWKAFYEVAYCSVGLQGAMTVPAMLKQWLGEDTLARPVLQALPHNPTTEMGQELLRIARTLQIERTAPTLDHPEVQKFLERYGHRAIREIDTGLPRWSEDPSYVLEILSAYVAQDNLEAKMAQFRAAQEEAEAAIPRIVEEVRRRKGGFQARKIARRLRCLREVGGMREQPKFDMIRCFALFRRVLFEVGQELVAQGRLDRADDVFYLTFAEIQGQEDLRARAAEGRAAYTREVNRTAVPRLMTSTGECFYHAPASPDANVLAGVPVSPGVYEGVARIVHAPTGAQLERGEILVTHSTDPSWTPLFLNAGAVIMETGGPISHGAIVAREYGIPAIAAVGEATTRLHTGQRLRVNGEAGEITCLD